MLIGLGRRNPKLHRKAQSLKSWAARRFGFAGSRAACSICASVDFVLKLAAYPRNHANVCSAIDAFTSLRLQAADVQGSAWTPCTVTLDVEPVHATVPDVLECPTLGPGFRTRAHALIHITGERGASWHPCHTSFNADHNVRSEEKC